MASEKITALIEEVKALTVLELSELVRDEGDNDTMERAYFSSTLPPASSSFFFSSSASSLDTASFRVLKSRPLPFWSCPSW